MPSRSCRSMIMLSHLPNSACYVRSTPLSCTYSTFAQDCGRLLARAPLSIRHGLSPQVHLFRNALLICVKILEPARSFWWRMIAWRMIAWRSHMHSLAGPSFFCWDVMPFFADLIVGSSWNTMSSPALAGFPSPGYLVYVDLGCLPLD
jgi:hypothetical protein